MNMMTLDGYNARIEYHADLDTFRGEILGLSGGADFFGKNPTELRAEFNKSLHVFLDVCREKGIEPLQQLLREAGHRAQSAPEYDSGMRVVTGTVIEGKVVLKGSELPDGTEVAVVVRESGSAVQLPADLQAELEDALDEADRAEGISADDLFAQLRKYG